jgi:hypothetical protein
VRNPGYLTGRLRMEHLMQLMFAYRGLVDTLGWSSLAKWLAPSLRGPLAYWLGLRFRRLNQPSQADRFLS